MIDYRWMSFLTREVMENAETYEEAKIMLSKPRLLAPVYFILGGVNSSQVIINIIINFSSYLKSIRNCIWRPAG